MLVIPACKKHEFLKDLHVGHLGDEKTLLKARECVYWQGITENIKEYTKGCNKCQSMKPSQQKEPLIQHDVPSVPWEKTGIDIFHYGSHEYLLVADYFSNFPLIRFLNNPMAAHVINILKMMFSEHGIPACVFTDQGDNSHLLSSESLQSSTGLRYFTQH